MQTNRIKLQIWVELSQEDLDKAHEIADYKRMTFRGWVSDAIEKAIKSDEGNYGSADNR